MLYPKNSKTLDPSVTEFVRIERMNCMNHESRSGDAPDFVEVGEAGIAVDDAMRHQRRVQLVG
jgi:hypothetical protein